MVKKKLIEEDLTYKIIGILYKIHNKLGPLQQEKHYQRAINNELITQKIKFERELPVRIEYEYKKIGEYKIDFLIENKLVLEIKAVNKFHPKFIEQILSYMNQLEIRVGLLVNFKKDKLRVKRLLLPEKYLKNKSA